MSPRSSADAVPGEDDVEDLSPDYSDFVSKYMRRHTSLSSYKAVTVGSTKAKVWFIETTQSIDVTAIKGEYSYVKNESHGAVDSVHEAYFHQNKAAVKNLGESEFKPVAFDDYLDTYGVNPFGYNIAGFATSNEAITSIERTTEEGYAFKLTFDPQKATTNVRIQMKAFGGLDDYPNFSNIAITIHVQCDFTPIKHVVVADYQAKRFGVGTDCHQEFTVSFSSINQTVKIPGLEAVRSLLD